MSGVPYSLMKKMLAVVFRVHTQETLLYSIELPSQYKRMTEENAKSAAIKAIKEIDEHADFVGDDSNDADQLIAVMPRPVWIKEFK